LTILLAIFMHCFVAALFMLIHVHKYIHFTFANHSSHFIKLASQTKLLSSAYFSYKIEACS